MAILPDLAHSFLEDLHEAGRSKLTLKQYESDLKKFFLWLEAQQKKTDMDTLKALRKDDIQQYFVYLHNKKLSHATIRRLATVLSRFLKYHQCVAAHDIHKLSHTAPLRSLTNNDFIENNEFNKLIHTIKLRYSEATGKKAARNFLVERNAAIASLIRAFGLTPTEVYAINMNHINLSQGELSIPFGTTMKKFAVESKIMDDIRKYFYAIPQLFRPRYHSQDPLFVAFNNISLSFQYDYDRQKPKALSVRAIQEMIKDEVKRAGLRKISAVTLRNTAILEEIQLGKTDEYIMERFSLTSEAALRRYKQYLLSLDQETPSTQTKKAEG